MRLDLTRPYAEVIGLPGVCYEQDGHCFNRVGNEVDQCGRPVLAPEPSHAEAVLAEVGERPYEAMHWKQLKVLVETFGGVWTDKEGAIRFLRGQQ